MVALNDPAGSSSSTRSNSTGPVLGRPHRQAVKTEQEKAVVRNRRSLWAMASELEVVPSVTHWYRSQAAERSTLMKLAPVAQEGVHGVGGGGWRRAGPGGGRPPNPAYCGPGAAIDDSGPGRATSEQLWYVAAASLRWAITWTDWTPIWGWSFRMPIEDHGRAAIFASHPKPCTVTAHELGSGRPIEELTYRR